MRGASLAHYILASFAWAGFVATAAAEVRVELRVEGTPTASQVVVGAYLRTGGQTVGATQNDIVFDHRVVQLPSAAACRINAAIGDRLPACEDSPPTAPCKTLNRHLANCADGPVAGCEGRTGDESRLRAVIGATAVPNINALPDGVLLYTCTFDIVDRAMRGFRLAIAKTVASTPSGERLTATGEDLVVGDPPTHTPGPSPTATASRTVTAPRSDVRVELRVEGTATASQVIVGAYLRSNGQTVGATQNDLVFDHRIVRLPSATACRINAAIGDRLPACEEAPPSAPCKTLTRHLANCADGPISGCEGRSGDESRLRAVIAATAVPNVNALPDGVLLYTCTFDVVDRNMRGFRLGLANLVASSPTGNRLTATGENLVVGEPATHTPVPSPTATASRTPTAVRPTRVPTDTRTSTPKTTPSPTFTPTRAVTGEATPETPEPTATSTDPVVVGKPTLTPTPTGRPNGFPCKNSGDCESTFCVDRTCCSTASCPSQRFCNISDANGECDARKNVGDGCNIDSDCVLRNCDLNPTDRPAGYAGACAPLRTPTPLAPGEACTDDRACGAGAFCNMNEGAICCDARECAPGFSCRVPGHEGRCSPVPTATPTGRPNGSRCVENKPELCSSGNCFDNTCCEDRLCIGTDRCDILGFEGRCAVPNQEGEPCRKNTDCELGLLCRLIDSSAARCVRVDATPTAVPTTLSTPTRVATIIISAQSSDGSGCAIASDGSNSWWLALPLLVLRRRRRR